MISNEMVVLCDEDGTPVGTALKSEVHTTETPLHLAFSCYVFNQDGEFLVTRRALSKKTWPGIWTNSACGHLAPGESALEAVERRVPHEIGVPVGSLDNIVCALPDFNYRAVDSRGIVEWEICPVFVATLKPGVEINPRDDEVEQLAWTTADELISAVEAAPYAFSDWMREQLSHSELKDILRERSA